MTPPVCPVFSNAQYLNTTLYVPENSLSQYMNSDGWKNFWDIRIIGDIINDVNSIEPEMLNQDIKKYNLNGNNVNEQYKGLVIIHYSDGTTKKIIQK